MAGTSKDSLTIQFVIRHSIEKVSAFSLLSGWRFTDFYSKSELKLSHGIHYASDRLKKIN